MKYDIFKTGHNMAYNREDFIRDLNGELLSGKDVPDYLNHWVIEDVNDGAYCYLDVVKVPTKEGCRYYVEKTDGSLKYLIEDYGSVGYEVIDADGDMVYYEDEEVIDKRGPEAGVYWRVIIFKNPNSKIKNKRFTDSYKLVTYSDGSQVSFSEYSEGY